MTDANVVMDQFMKRLSDNGFKKENQPNDGPDIDEKFIEKKLQSYSSLLKSGIIEAALDK